MAQWLATLPRFQSENAWGSLQPSIAPGLENPAPFSAPCLHTGIHNVHRMYLYAKHSGTLWGQGWSSAVKSYV